MPSILLIGGRLSAQARAASSALAALGRSAALPQAALLGGTGGGSGSVPVSVPVPRSGAVSVPVPGSVSVWVPVPASGSGSVLVPSDAVGSTTASGLTIGLLCCAAAGAASTRTKPLPNTASSRTSALLNSSRCLAILRLDHLASRRSSVVTATDQLPAHNWAGTNSDRPDPLRCRIDAPGAGQAAPRGATRPVARVSSGGVG